MAPRDDRDIEPELIRELAAELEIELALDHVFDPDLEVDIEIVDGSLTIARDTVPVPRVAIEIDAGHRAARNHAPAYQLHAPWRMDTEDDARGGFEDSDDKWFVSFDETQPIDFADEPTTPWRRLRRWARNRTRAA